VAVLPSGCPGMSIVSAWALAGSSANTNAAK
jgi:hypothetical protein